jgi:hypothetical protein
MIFASAAMITLMISTACGDTDQNSTAATPVENPVQNHMNLSPKISIGVEIGDTNYVFGQIVDAFLDENGDVLVLDSSTMNVRKYSSDGSFIGSAGRQGTGPGEFQRPSGMTVLGNNDFIVSDRAGGAISIFNDSMNWTETITGFFPRPPFVVSTAGDSAFVGMLPKFDRDEGLNGYSIARLENSSEPAAVYDELMKPFDPSRIGPFGDEENPVFTSDNSGRVFIAKAGTNAIIVNGYYLDGEQFLSINESISRVAKTEEELAREQEEFEEFSSQMGGRGGRMSGMELSFDPITFRRAVTCVGIDCEERLWVRLGAYRYPFWNVYDLAGELLFTASFESDDPDMDFMEVRITENGATAWIPDPLDWPKVMVLEIPETI